MKEIYTLCVTAHQIFYLSFPLCMLAKCVCLSFVLSSFYSILKLYSFSWRFYPSRHSNSAFIFLYSLVFSSPPPLPPRMSLNTPFPVASGEIPSRVKSVKVLTRSSCVNDFTPFYVLSHCSSGAPQENHSRLWLTDRWTPREMAGFSEPYATQMKVQNDLWPLSGRSGWDQAGCVMRERGVWNGRKWPQDGSDSLGPLSPRRVPIWTLAGSRWCLG